MIFKKKSTCGEERQLRLERLEGRRLLHADLLFSPGIDAAPFVDARQSRLQDSASVGVRAHEQTHQNRDANERNSRQTRHENHRERHRNDRARDRFRLERSEEYFANLGSVQDPVVYTISSTQADTLSQRLLNTHTVLIEPRLSMASTNFQAVILSVGTSSSFPADQSATTDDVLISRKNPLEFSTPHLPSQVDAVPNSSSDLSFRSELIEQDVSGEMKEDHVEAVIRNAPYGSSATTLVVAATKNSPILESLHVDDTIRVNAATLPPSLQESLLLSWLDQATSTSQQVRDLEQTINAIALDRIRGERIRFASPSATALPKLAMDEHSAQINANWLSRMDQAILLIPGPQQVADFGSLVVQEQEQHSETITWTSGVGFIHAIEFAGEIGVARAEFFELVQPAEPVNAPLASTQGNLSFAAMHTEFTKQLKPLMNSLRTPAVIGIAASVLGIQYFRGKYRNETRDESNIQLDDDELLFSPGPSKHWKLWQY